MYATSSPSYDDVRAAVQKISEHLEEEGLFLMSVQSAPGRDSTTSSTPLRQTLENDDVATKVITEEGNMRVKRRELFKGSKLEGVITHRFLTLDIEEFNRIAEDYGLYSLGFSQTQHAYICRKT